MSRVRTVALVAFFGGVAATVLAVFLHSQHLERGAAWASIIGLPVAIIGLVLAAIPLWPARGRVRTHIDKPADAAADSKSTTYVPPAPQPHTQFNAASGGGAVYAVQGGVQHVHHNGVTGGFTPPSPAQAEDEPQDNGA